MVGQHVTERLARTAEHLKAHLLLTLGALAAAAAAAAACCILVRRLATDGLGLRV